MKSVLKSEQSFGSKLNSKIANKKGLNLAEGFQAVLLTAVIGVLFIVVIYLFNQFGSTFTANSAAANASASLTTQFSNQIPLVGLVLAIVLIAIVIGVLLSSFFFLPRGGRA